MKPTRSTRQQTPSSPRFSRGLELGLWMAGALLLTYGLAHFQSGKKETEVVTSPASPASHSEQATPNPPPSEWVHAETPAQTYFKNRIAKIESEPDMELREQLITSLVDSVALADIPSLLTELGGMRRNLDQPGLINDISLRLVRRWAQHDAAAASVWAQQLPAGDLRQDAMTGVAIEWANVDLDSTIAWARQLPGAAEQKTLLLAAANEAARTDPMAALRIAVTLPADGERNETIRRAATEWTSHDATSAVDWAKQIPDEILRSQVLAAEAVAWSESKPESAATLAVENLPTGRLLDDTVVSIVQRWAQRQPEAAAAWVEQFPEGTLRVTAMENLIAQASPADTTDPQ